MRKILVIVFAVLNSTFCFSQDITGSWNGNIIISENKIPIVFHFYKDSSGTLNGKWDSPSQNAKNLPCNNVAIINDSLKVGLQIISGSYAGKFVNKDSVSGMWHQGSLQIPLNISKSNGATFEPPKRPQTPKPPFNYVSEDVNYFNADQSIQFGGTFTRPPAGDKKYPVVLLITGSGKQDRDETIFDHKPFAVIADYLTKKGIAVLRVDDRGMGQTTGNFDTSSSQDFADDVETGIRYLQSRRDVDAKHIGLIGHSEGGMIAPMVAARNKNVSFIVMLAGTGVPGSVINDFQNTLSMRSAGISDTFIQKFLDLHHALVNAATSSLSMDDFKNQVSQVYYNWKKNQSEATLNELIHGTDEQVLAVFQKQYFLFHSKWWNFFLKHDPADDLENLSIPVLALNGSKDIQVDAPINLTAIEAALKKSKSKNYKTIELPGLNHLFQHCVKCTIDEYGELEETIAPEVLRTIGEWIESVTKD